jgi:hypothetical protein
MVDDYGLDFFLGGGGILAWIGLGERCNCHEEDRITKLLFLVASDTVGVALCLL